MTGVTAWVRRVGFAGLCISLLATMGPGAAKAADWDTALKGIEQKYYQHRQPQAAMQELEDQLASAGRTYTAGQLDKILAMMKDYFPKTKETARFKKMVYDMLEPNYMDKIVGTFRGTSLYDAARDVRTEWLVPAAATLRVDAAALEVGESTAFSFAATNKQKVALADPGLTVSLTPEGFARIEGNNIVAVKSGEVTLVVALPDGTTLDESTITIKAGLSATVTPDYMQMNKKQVEAFTIEANKSFDKYPILLKYEPSGLISGQEMPAAADASKKVVRITALAPGTGFLKVLGPNGNELSRATIYIPPVAPSKLWPYIGSGATVLGAIWAFTATSGANSKFDEHEQCVLAGGTPEECQALFDDYESANTTATIAWTFTAVAAGATGYLWYKWWGANKTYKAKLAEAPQGVGLMITPTEAQVALSLRF